MLQVLTFEPAMAHVLVHSGFCAADFLYLNEAKHEELMGLSASMEVLGRPLTLLMRRLHSCPRVLRSFRSSLNLMSSKRWPSLSHTSTQNRDSRRSRRFLFARLTSPGIG